MAVSKQINTGTVYNLVQHSSYMNLTFIVNERKQNHSQCYNKRCCANAYVKCSCNPLPQHRKRSSAKSSIQCKCNSISRNHRTITRIANFFSVFLLLFFIDF